MDYIVTYIRVLLRKHRRSGNFVVSLNNEKKNKKKHKMYFATNAVSTFLYTQIHSTASQLFHMSLGMKQVITLNNVQKHSSGCEDASCDWLIGWYQN